LPARLDARRKAKKAKLAKRERALLNQKFRDWTAPLARFQIGTDQAEFERGLLSTLVLRDVDVTDASLAPLVNVPELQHLDLRGTSITNKGMEHLAGITNLSELDVSETKVTPEGLASLKGLKRLVRVYNFKWGNERLPAVEKFKQIRNQRFQKLKGSAQRAEALRALKIIIGRMPAAEDGTYPVIRYSQSWASDADLIYLKAIPEVEDLDLFECGAVTSEGLKHLEPLKSLRILRLSETSVIDLAPLSRLTALEELDLSSLEKLDARSFRHLQSLKNLRRLTIRFCNLADEVLPHIAECAELREIEMIYNKFTGAGLSHLRRLKKLEKVEIDYEDQHRDLIQEIVHPPRPAKTQRKTQRDRKR
jgi:hypothetical protein